jgi:hypothetical protein
MRLRRRWVLVGLAGLVLLSAPLWPWGYDAVPGLLRGEHFYLAGFPTGREETIPLHN